MYVMDGLSCIICILPLLDIGRSLYAASILIWYYALKIQWLKLNIKKNGFTYRLKEGGFLLQLTACEILAKIFWNSDGSSDLIWGLLYHTAVQFK